MQQCPNCGHHNRAGIVFCENCGASLIGKVPLSTKSLDSSSEEEKSQLGVDASVLTDVQVQGVAIFEEGSLLRLEIDGSPEPIVFKPTPETIFGRRDPATGAMPDIDLTPFAGYRMGVSRRHAAIRRGEELSLEIWDLGSSNGTFLNSQRLSAHRPYRLRDGDELRLGQMIIRVYFQPAEKIEAAPAAESAPAKAEKAEAVAPQPPTVALPSPQELPVLTAPPATAPLADKDAAGAETPGDKEAAAQAEAPAAPAAVEKPTAQIQPTSAAPVVEGQNAGAKPPAPVVEKKEEPEAPPAAAQPEVGAQQPASPSVPSGPAEPKPAVSAEVQPELPKPDQASGSPKPDQPLEPSRPDTSSPPPTTG